MAKLTFWFSWVSIVTLHWPTTLPDFDDNLQDHIEETAVPSGLLSCRQSDHTNNPLFPKSD